jgi:hypothetical protein
MRRFALLALGIIGCGGASGGGAGGGTGGTQATGAGGMQASGAGGGSPTTGAGGAQSGTGGASSTTGAGGMQASGAGGATGAGGSTPTMWPAADPGKTGPFQTVTQMNVSGNADPTLDFTLVRPTQFMGRHPVITWGNGTGTSPSVYSRLLTLYASHGFIVIASNNPNVGMVQPPPMLEAVSWVLAQDADSTSVLYQHVDHDHIGATGHSQGGFAATSAGSDARIVTIAPIAGATANRTLHGPALLLCGGMDTTVPCSTIQTAYTGINNVPVMLADQLAVDHTNWIFTQGGGQNPYYTVTTAWFRVQLMGDTALSPMFYGACSICQDTATWSTMRKMIQ